MIWQQYSSQSLNGHLPTTDSKRTKKWVPALTSFAGRFPEKMGGAGNALIQYLCLTFYIGSHFSITDTKGVRDTRSWLQYFSRTPRVSPDLTHFPAHYHISGCAESVYSYTICHTLPFIQWLLLPLTLLKPSFQVIENEDEFRVGISSIIEYHFCGINVEVSFRRMKCHTGLLSSFCNGLVRKTPPERGIFFRLQVSMKEKGFHLLNFMKG